MPRPTGRRARVLPDGSPRRPAKHTPRNLSRFRRPEAASPQTVVRVLRPAVIKGRPPIRPPPAGVFPYGVPRPSGAEIRGRKIKASDAGIFIRAPPPRGQKIKAGFSLRLYSFVMLRH